MAKRGSRWNGRQQTLRQLQHIRSAQVGMDPPSDGQRVRSLDTVTVRFNDGSENITVDQRPGSVEHLEMRMTGSAAQMIEEYLYPGGGEVGRVATEVGVDYGTSAGARFADYALAQSRNPANDFPVAGRIRIDIENTERTPLFDLCAGEQPIGTLADVVAQYKNLPKLAEALSGLVKFCQLSGLPMTHPSIEAALDALNALNPQASQELLEHLALPPKPNRAIDLG